MVTLWIVKIMSVMFLMPTQEFGGTMMMPISLKLVFLTEGVYIRKRHKKKSGPDKILSVVYIRKRPPDIMKLYFCKNSLTSPNPSYEESNGRFEYLLKRFYAQTRC